MLTLFTPSSLLTKQWHEAWNLLSPQKTNSEIWKNPQRNSKSANVTRAAWSEAGTAWLDRLVWIWPERWAKKNLRQKRKEEKRIAPQHMLSSSHGCSFVRISMTFKRRKSTLLHLIRCLFSGCFKFLRSCFCDTLWPSEQSEKSPFSHFPYFTF